MLDNNPFGLISHMPVSTMNLSNAIRIWARRAILLMAFAAIVLCALLVFGAYLPDVPYIGVFGSVAVSLAPAWLIVVPALATITLLLAGGSTTSWIALAASVATAFGAANVIYRVTGVASANGVQIGWQTAFGSTRSLAEVQPDEVVTYTRDAGEDLTLRVYYPRGLAPQGGWPVLMYVHGGGWISMSNAQRSSDMRWFADQGWVAIAVGYSLSSERDHFWNQVHAQIGCSMSWVADHIGLRGGNARRLAMFGESAGGNLVLNASYMANAGILPSVCGGTVPRVIATSAIYPAVDLVAIEGNTYVPTGPMVRDMAIQYTGGTSREFPDRYVSVASATYISPKAPPTLLVVSENDHLVPRDSMDLFDTRIRAAGIPGKKISVPFAEHGFDLTGIGNSIVRQATLFFLNSIDSQ